MTLSTLSTIVSSVHSIEIVYALGNHGKVGVGIGTGIGAGIGIACRDRDRLQDRDRYRVRHKGIGIEMIEGGIEIGLGIGWG